MKIKNCFISILFLVLLISGNTVLAATAPIYRLYHEGTGEHLYTPDENEYYTLRENGWNDEGTGWYAPEEGTPVYRLNNDSLQNHLYTTDENEVRELTANHGWTQDFNGQPMFYSGGSIPVFRLYNYDLRGMHLLTVDNNEYNVLPDHGWKQEGVALYGFSDPSGLNLEVDQNYTDKNISKKVTFSLENHTDSLPELYCDSEKVGVMNDEGKNGDKKAGDKVYSLNVDVHSSTPCTFDYIVKCSNAQSEPVPVYVLDNYKSSDSNQVDNIENNLKNIENDALKNKEANSSELIDYYNSKVEDYVNKLMSQGEIIDYEIDKDLCQTRIKYKSGTTLVYQPEGKYFLENGGTSIATYEPYRSQFSDCKIDQVADLIVKSFDNYEHTTNSDDNQVTLAKIKNSFGPNQLILWNGHGGHSSKIGDFICIKEPLMEGVVPEEDWKSDAVIRCEGNETGLSYKFFEKYCTNMRGSVVYLGTCHSAESGNIASALIGNGAAAVIGNTGTILAEYNHKMMYGILDTMTQINPKTNNYYTIQEAISYNQEIYGKDSGSYARSHYPEATLIDFSNTNPFKRNETLYFTAKPVVIGSNAKNLRLAENNVSIPDTGTDDPSISPDNKPIVVLSPDFSSLENVGLVQSLNVSFKAEGSSVIKDLGSHSNGWLIGTGFGGCVLYPNEVNIGEYYLTFTNENTGKTYSGSTKVTKSDLTTSEEAIQKKVKMKEGEGPTLPDVDNPNLIAYPSYISATNLPNNYHVYFRPEGSNTKDDLGVKTLDGNGNITINNVKPGIYFFVNTDWNTNYDAMIGAIKITQDQIDAKRNIRTDFWLVPDKYFSGEYGYDFN